MNQGGYFGAYRGGFQTLPDNAYEMMTAPSRQISGAIEDASSQINNALVERYTQQRGTEALKQGNIAQYKGLESISKATGVPVNPELTNQFANMGEMKAREQQAAFQQSLNQELQRQQMLYGIANQQRQAQQAQRGLNYQSLGQSLDVDPYTPPPLPTTQNAQGGMPAFNPLFNVSPAQTGSQYYWEQSMGRR
jgi:hypothetical protein